MQRAVLRGALVVLVAIAAIFAGDWTVWRIRGGPFDTVTVNRVVVAPLKGGREEYYADGTADVRCSRSMLPAGSAEPCWWVRRHRVVWDR